MKKIRIICEGGYDWDETFELPENWGDLDYSQRERIKSNLKENAERIFKEDHLEIDTYIQDHGVWCEDCDCFLDDCGCDQCERCEEMERNCTCKDKKCSNCGKKFDGDRPNYCSFCGNSLDNSPTDEEDSGDFGW